MVQKNRKLSLAIRYLLLILTASVTLFPIIYIFLSSFKTNTDILAYPQKLITDSMSFDNYIRAWNSPHFQVKDLLLNSILYTVANVAISLFVSSMSGYVFAIGRFPGKKLIFAVFSSLMFITLGGVSVYATFEVYNLLHIPRSLWSLVVLSLFSVPLTNMYLINGYVKSLPGALNEAAKIDGASFPVIFAKIYLPLIVPVMATVAILAFNTSWNNYVMPTVFTLSRPKERTLIVGLMALKNSGGAATQWDLMLAGSVIALIPVLLAYSVCNRYFVSGLAAGAVKG